MQGSEAVIFFFQFCDVAQMALIHKYLTKFDDIQNMKVERIWTTLSY